MTDKKFSDRVDVSKNLSRRGGWFGNFARDVSYWSGRPLAFGLSLLIVVTWFATGPLFHFSDTWQLVINTGTTIVTFLMVFLIQNAQNRDNQAIQLKLDELIRAQKGAHTALIDIEEITDEELAKLKSQYLELAGKGRENLRRGGMDTDTPPLSVR